jgi:hypothetical protein
MSLSEKPLTRRATPMKKVPPSEKLSKEIEEVMTIEQSSCLGPAYEKIYFL